MSTGIYLKIEGPDGCGKSTQTRRLVATLQAEWRRVWSFSQPTNGRVGRLIRECLSGADPIEDPRALQLLFAADRQELAPALRRTLAKGDVVVCDRGALSTWAYGLAMARAAGDPHAEAVGRWADVLSDWAVKPAAIIVLDTPLDVCMRRLAARPGQDITEREAVLRHAHAIYRHEAEGSRLGGLVRRVDGSGSEAEVAARVLDVVRPLLPTETP